MLEFGKSPPKLLRPSISIATEKTDVAHPRLTLRSVEIRWLRPTLRVISLPGWVRGRTQSRRLSAHFPRRGLAGLRLLGGCRRGLEHALWRRRLAYPDCGDDRGQQPKAGQRIEPAGEAPGVVLEPTDDRRRDAAVEDADRVDPGDAARQDRTGQECACDA